MSRKSMLFAVTFVVVALAVWVSPAISPVVEAQKTRQQEARVQATLHTREAIAVLVTLNGVGVDNLGSDIEGNKDGITLPDGWGFHVPFGYTCDLFPTSFRNEGGGSYVIGLGALCDATADPNGNPAIVISIATPTLAGGTVSPLLFSIN